MVTKLKILIPLFCILLLLSCNEKQKKYPEYFDKEFFNSYKVEFLNSSIKLPKVFKAYDYESLLEIAKHKPNDTVMNFLLQTSKGYKFQKQKPVFFKDSILNHCYIGIYPMLHLPITKGDASFFVSFMANQMKDLELYYDIKSEILEKRFKSFKGHKMIKLKVLQTDSLKNQRFYNNYCVSGPNHSFFVIHFDVFLEDIENNIKDLSLRSRK